MTARKPRDKEIDVFGLTHRGHVRKLNQDHFMISFLRKHMDVASTSLPNVDQLSLGSERMGSFLMVADGVGGRNRRRRGEPDYTGSVGPIRGAED